MADDRPTILYPGSWAALKPLLPPQGARIVVPAGDWTDPFPIKTDGRVTIDAQPGARFVAGGPTGPPRFSLDSLTATSGKGILELLNVHQVRCGGGGVSVRTGEGLLMRSCHIESPGNHGIIASWGFGHVVLDDVTVSNAGSHGTYIQANHVLVRGGHYYGSLDGTDALRVVGWNVFVDGVRCETGVHGVGPKGSSMLLSFLSAARTHVQNSRFERDGSYLGHPYMVAYRCRQGHNGSGVAFAGGEPITNPAPGLAGWRRFGPYQYLTPAHLTKVSPVVRDPRFWDRPHWERAVAGGLLNPANPYLSRHTQSANAYVQVGDVSRGTGILFEGLAPVNHADADKPGREYVEGAKGGQDDYILPLGDGWADTSLLETTGNMFDGIATPCIVRDAAKWVPGQSDSAWALPSDSPTASHVVDLDDVLLPGAHVDLGRIPVLWPEYGNRRVAAQPRRQADRG